MEWVLRPAQGLRGEFIPPADKSITHRAYLFAAAARTPSEIENPLQSHDCEATLNALIQMGAEVRRLSGAAIALYPPTEWHSPAGSLDCGNSGTTMRLLMGMIASRPLVAELQGDASLSRRPMERVASPLLQMGATIEGSQAPLRIRGGELEGIDFVSPVASAQVKSAVLLAGLRARGTTWVREPELSRDHTERFLSGLGVDMLRRPDGAIGVEGGAEWEGFRIRVPGDLSSAAFWIVAACLVPGADLVVRGVGVNPTRTGLLKVLTQMGADLEVLSESSAQGEPVADLRIRFRSGLRPFKIEGEIVPQLIDEVPVLSVLATQAEGTSTLRDAAELRVKESDRIASTAEMLRKMGAQVEVHPDGLDIHGPVQLGGTRVDCNLDHRIAMAAAVASLIAADETRIAGAEAVLTSYPHFLDELNRLRVD